MTNLRTLVNNMNPTQLRNLWNDLEDILVDHEWGSVEWRALREELAIVESALQKVNN